MRSKIVEVIAHLLGTVVEDLDHAWIVDDDGFQLRSG